MPSEKLRAMEALYAFMRHSDDLVDAPSCPADNSGFAIDLRREQLHRWRTSLENALRGGDNYFADLNQISAGQVPDAEATATQLLPALIDTIKKYAIPADYLYTVLDGMEMDLDQRRYETFEELRFYCQRVASAVGLACIHIWGFRGQGTPEGDAAYEPAWQAGIALQLTNILRDLKADAAADRIYLPLEDLRSCGYSVEELKRGVVNEGFYRLMKMEIERAEQFYSDGSKLLKQLHSDGRRIFELMTFIYRNILRLIARRPKLVFVRPVGLSIFHRFSLFYKWATLMIGNITEQTWNEK